ncbi:MAG: hypothetical protein IT317_12965 [Anaerolineales bacterium]|nr:hypothetical protein [Anaerolineales bacterium]
MPTSADTFERAAAPSAHWVAQLPPLIVVALAALILLAPVRAWRWFRASIVGALFEPYCVVSPIGGPGWVAKAHA